MFCSTLAGLYSPTIGFDERNNKDTTEALQQNAIVHTGCRVRDGDVPIHGLLGDQGRTPDHCTADMSFLTSRWKERDKTYPSAKSELDMSDIKSRVLRALLQFLGSWGSLDSESLNCDSSERDWLAVSPISMLLIGEDFSMLYNAEAREKRKKESVMTSCKQVGPAVLCTENRQTHGRSILSRGLGRAGAEKGQEEWFWNGIRVLG